MKLPLHLFRLQPPSSERPCETVEIVTRAEARPSKPTFRAPALPTPHQLSSDLPFTANIRPRIRDRD